MPDMKFIGGRVCLDFVNTVGARVSRHGKRSRDYADSVLRDKLNNYQDLLTWSQLAGLATKDEVHRLGRVAERHPQHAARTLTRAKRLREALYRIFKSLLEGWPPWMIPMWTFSDRNSRLRRRTNGCVVQAPDLPGRGNNLKMLWMALSGVSPNRPRIC